MAMVNGVNVPFVPIVKNDSEVSRLKIKDFNRRFDEVLNDEINRIKFSNHALKRLEDRSLELSRDELLELNNAVSQAEEKGSRDSLIMLNNKAFIVNIPNKTVVTAMAVGDGNDVFTNIDSVVIK